MSTNYIETIYYNRPDLSTFLVHLTRDQEDAKNAKDTLIQILDSNTLISKNPVGLFYKHPENPNNFNSTTYKDKLTNYLKCICLTETPLDQIKNFIEISLPWHDDKLLTYSKYGLVFTKSYIVQNGGNPCFYVNTEKQTTLESSFLSIFNKTNWEDFCNQNMPPNSPLNLIPFVNIFGKGGSKIVDYYWEREWRIRKDKLEFNYSDVIVGLCKEEDIPFFKSRYNNQIHFISPDWSISRMIEELKK